MMKKKKLKYLFWASCLGRWHGKSGNGRRKEGRRERGRPQRNWMANLREWSEERGVELSRIATNREGWRKAVHSWANQRLARLRT